MSYSFNKVPFVFKFNRWSLDSYICLKFWLLLAANTGRKCIIIQDLWTSDNFPEEFNNLINSMELELLIKNTNYEKADNLKFVRPESKHWARAAAANLTAFDYITNDYFWLIDADDTIFLTDPKIILEKFCVAEEFAFLKKLDAFSYAFYRHIPADHWSLGIALMKSAMPLNEIINVSADDVISLGIADNIDGALDFLRRRGRLNLQSFIFNNIVFHHHTPAIASWNIGAPYGVYDWRSGILNGVTKAPEDVMSI